MCRHRCVLISALALGLAAPILHAAPAPRPARASHAQAVLDDSAMASVPAHTLLGAGDTVAVPLDLTLRQPVVSVFLNGHGPYRMFLDTGAGTTVLDRGLEQELGLVQRGETRIGDPANPQAIAADVVTLDTLRIGAAVFTGVRAASFDRSGIRTGPDVPRGVVGFPVFHELLETLDFPGATLRLTRGHLGEPDGRSVLTYDAPDAIPTITVDVAGVPFRAHLDTGSPGFLSIPEKDSSRVRFAGPTQIVGRGRTVNSEIVFRGAPLDGAVRVGGATFDRPLVVLNDVLPQANLGSRALADCVLTIDAANQRLSIVRTRAAARDAVGAADLHGGAHETHTVVSGPGPGEKMAGVGLSPQPDGRLVVAALLPGSVASKADIQVGDEVLALDGDAVAGLTHEENRARLHRSPVTIRLKRGEKVFDVTLTF